MEGERLASVILGDATALCLPFGVHVEVKGVSAWQHVFDGVIKDTLIERAPSLPRILLCNYNKYIFNDRCGIYILEMALRNRS